MRLPLVLLIACVLLVHPPSVRGQNTTETLGLDGGGAGSIDWSPAGNVEAQGEGFPRGDESFEGQREANARRAAITVAQRRLLEIVQGVAVYGGVTLGDAMGAEDVIATRVSGVLRGAVVVEGSEAWDPNASRYTLTMSVPLAGLRQAIPPLRVTNGRPVVIRDAGAKANVRVAPVAAADRYRVVQGEATRVARQKGVLANDRDANRDTLRARLVLGVSHGKLSLNPDGSFTYLSGGGSAAGDSFVYRAYDGPKGSGPVLASGNTRVTIEVAARARASNQTSRPEPMVESEAAPPPPNPSPPRAPESDGTDDTLPPSGENALRAASPVASEEENVGGPLDAVIAPLPTGIILDASQFDMTRQLFMAIYSSSGEILYDRIEATYIADALDVVERDEQVADRPEIMEVFTLSPNQVDIVLSRDSTDRFRNLMEQKDYVALGNLVVVEREP